MSDVISAKELLAYLRLLESVEQQALIRFVKNMSKKSGWDGEDTIEYLTGRLEVAASEKRWVDVVNYAIMLYGREVHQ